MQAVLNTPPPPPTPSYLCLLVLPSPFFSSSSIAHSESFFYFPQSTRQDHQTTASGGGVELPQRGWGGQERAGAGLPVNTDSVTTRGDEERSPCPSSPSPSQQTTRGAADNLRHHPLLPKLVLVLTKSVSLKNSRSRSRSRST